MLTLEQLQAIADGRLSVADAQKQEPRTAAERAREYRQRQRTLKAQERAFGVFGDYRRPVRAKSTGEAMWLAQELRWSEYDGSYVRGKRYTESLAEDDYLMVLTMSEQQQANAQQAAELTEHGVFEHHNDGGSTEWDVAQRKTLKTLRRKAKELGVRV